MKRLKLKNISNLVAIALLAMASESNAVPPLTNPTPYSSATTGVGYDTTYSTPILSGVTPEAIDRTGIDGWPGAVGPTVTPGYNKVGSSVTVTNTGTVASDTGFTANSGYTISNTSTILVTGGNNTGIVLRSMDHRSHTAYASIYATTVMGTDATAIAHSVADSTAHVDLNTVSNSGTITANTGIGLISSSAATSYAQAQVYIWANNDLVGGGEDPRASLTASAYSAASSTILSNAITNSGSILASDYGIQLKSSATGIRTTIINKDAYTSGAHNWGSGGFNYATNFTDTGGPFDTYYTQVSSQVGGASAGDRNSITNSGSIVVSNGAGIVLNAEAVGATSLGATASYAYSKVIANTISNSGLIAAKHTTSTNISDGIGLYAATSGANIAGFTALVDSNTITNTNLIYAMNNGINLTATSSYVNVASAAVTSNTINNNYIGWDDEPNTAKGRIVANYTGVNIVATTVNGNTINNSGLVVSDPGMTIDGTTGALTKSSSTSNPTGNINFVAINIHGAGAGNTLNLNAPSYLAGRILLSNGTGSGNNSNTTVNLTSGYSHSNVWSIQNDVLGVNTYGPLAVNKNGPLPWFVRENTIGINGVRNNTYATIDPTALTARPNMIADLSDSTYTLMANNITKDLKADGRTWIAGQMGTIHYDPSESGPAMDQKTNLYTVALGHDETVGDAYRVGMMIGYNRSDLNTGSLYSDLYANSYKNSSTGGFAGIYANTKVDFLDIDAGLSAGIQRHSDSRFVNDNLKWWGISYANSKYDSQWVSPSIKVGLPIDLGSGFVVSPNVQVAYTYHHIDNYTETGSNSNASYNAQDIGVVESKVALDLTQTIDDLKATVTLGYLNRDLVTGDSVRVTMIGDTHDVQSLYETHNAGFVRGGLRWDMSDDLALNLAGTYMQGSRSGTNGGNGNISIQYKF